MSIKFLAEDDRPREKLRNKGAQALSDAELLALLIGSGTTKKSAVDLARELLATSNNNLNQLGKCNLSDLQKVKENHVFIHDGARPYVSKQSINDLVECLKTYDAGLLMVPCKDTIKEVKEGIVVKTLKRE